jgi:hypothetical protein
MVTETVISVFAVFEAKTFPDPVFIHEFNAGSLRSGLDRFYGLLGNLFRSFSKSTTVEP